MTNNQTPQRVGLIGWPVEHSFSPLMHQAAFQALGWDHWTYELVPVPPEQLPSIWPELASNYIGLNVTLPYKQAVLEFIQGDAISQSIQAANTICFRYGFATNTDVEGFMGDLQEHNIPVIGKRVLILGAGGAARAAIYGLLQKGAQIFIINRTYDKIAQITKDLQAELAPLNYAQASQLYFDLIVNCTSVGMWPHTDRCPWPNDLSLPNSPYLYDTIYRPQQTQLMRRAEEQGMCCYGGLGMLLGQGTKSFTIWTEQKAPVDAMRETLEKSFQETDENK